MKYDIHVLNTMKEFREAKQYWLNQLSGEWMELQLPADVTTSIYQSETYSVGLGKELSEQLLSMSKHRDTSLFILLQAALKVFLYKYIQQKDIAITTPVLVDSDQEIYNAGIVLRDQLQDGMTYQELVMEVSSTTVEGFKNQFYPLEVILEELGIQEEQSLFRIMIMLEGLHNLELAYPLLSSMKNDVCFSVLKKGSQLEVCVIYNQERFKMTTVQKWVDMWMEVLKQATSQPNKKIMDFELVSTKEKEQILTVFNQLQGQPYEHQKTIHMLFEEQVEKTPNHTAVVFEDQQLTYQQLNDRANQLARVLRGQGVTSETIVGLFVNRSLEMIVGMLAVLKAGGAYLPIDPEYPMERIEYMLQDSKTSLLLITSATEGIVPFAIKTIHLDDPACYQGDSTNLSPISESHHLAYIIYTSGSTGKPKGVMLEHKGIANLLVFFKEHLAINEQDRIVQFASTSFDASVWEIYMSLLTGATLYIPTKSVIQNNYLFEKYCTEHLITTVTLPPTYLKTLRPEQVPSIKRMISAGSELEPQLVEQWKSHVQLINAYGPTETTICATYWKASKEESVSQSVPIGKPIPNTQVYILDPHLCVQPVGVVGELCVAGEGLARGYLGKKELTDEKFISHPFAPGKLLYKTGDLAKWLPNGNIEYVGRIDHQIKIRGFRIEVGEIEAALLSHKAMKEAVVIDQEDHTGEKFLCAYVVATESVTASELQSYLSLKLPHYMIPAYIIQLDAIPLTMNGKVDRKALPHPQESGVNQTTDAYVAPKNEIEEKLAEAWQEVLGYERVGMTDNFFTLGGDSIKAIQIAGRLQSEGFKLEIKDIFRYPTIESLSMHVSLGEIEVIEQSPVVGKVELTPIQRWFFDQQFTNMHHWNQAWTLYRKDGFDVEIIKQVFDKIVEHHDALRMIYRSVGEQVIQYNRGLEGEHYHLQVFEVAEEDIFKRIEQEANKMHESMDLFNGPLFQLGLFQTNNGDYLFMAIHHLVVDMVSWRILLEDMDTLYHQALKQEELKLPSKTHSYQEWSHRLQEYANSESITNEISYWKSVEQAGVATLPKDHITTEARVEDCQRLMLTLSETETERLLKHSNQAKQTKVDLLLLSAVGLALKKWASIDQILVQVEKNGREEIIDGVNITRTVGWFTSTFPLLLDLSDVESVAESITRVRDRLESVPNNGIGYSVMKYLSQLDEVWENLYFDIKPEVNFNYLGQITPKRKNGDFVLLSEPVGHLVSPQSERLFTLDINSALINGQLHVALDYNKYEYEDLTMQLLIDELKQSLLQIIEYYSTNLTVESDTSQSEAKQDVVISREQMYEPFPLSEVQVAYLVGRDSQFEIGGVSTHGYFELESVLDMERFNQSLQKVIDRHPMLRVIILPDGTQKILKDLPPYVMEIEDLRHLNSEEQETRILEYREQMSHHIFQHDQWPLFEFKAFRLTDEKSILCVSVDLLVTDGASLHIIGEELVKFYNDPHLKLPELEFTFRDYMLAYKEFKNTSQTYAADKEYWMTKLEDFPLAPPMPLKVDPSTIQEPKFERFTKLIEQKDWEKLKRFAQSRNITTSALLCTAYAQVLAYWSNQSRLGINLTVFNRHPFHPDVNHIVGDFTSLISLDVDLKANRTFWERAADTQDVLIESLQHRNFDGVEFSRELAKYHNLGTKAVLPIVFTSLLFNDGRFYWSDIGTIRLGVGQTSQVYLDNQVMEVNGSLQITWDFVKDLFEPEVIHHMFQQYIGLIEQLIEYGEVVSQLSMPDRDYRLIEQANATEIEIAHTTLDRLFVEQVKKTPERIAVVFAEDQLTYEELHEKSNQVARYLQEQGVGPNHLIGVLAQRCTETIVNVMGILKAGAAYVPVDPDYPEDRQTYILENSRCSMLLKPELYEAEDLSRYVTDDLEPISQPEDIAYVIYTSGSTGRPKGVVISHQAASNTIQDINQKFSVNEQDKIIGLSSMCFDLSVYDIFGALSTGATLVMIADQRDIYDVKATIEQHQITIWNSVPAIMDLLVDHVEESFINHSLRVVMMSGDWIPLQLPEKVRTHFPRAEVISLGGATEASIWSIYYPIGEVRPEWKSIPYGVPLANQKFYILNYEQQPCPVGVEGELYIGGIGVAEGYHHDEEKTRNAFIEHPELGRLYRTGDHGMWHEEGYIVFLGRKDHQVKIRGYRVELGEIETCLIQHEKIRNAVVIDRMDEYGKKYLCAYVVWEEEVSIHELREYLAKQLPDYMIPTYFVPMAAIPLTANGKVDRKSLPEPELLGGTTEEYVEPSDEIEEKIAEFCAEVLGVERVGVHDSFLELGGTSIHLVKLHARVEKLVPGLVKVTDFFTYTSISKLAAYIRNKMEAEQTKISLQPITLPLEYFHYGSDDHLENKIHMTLDSNIYQQLKSIAQMEQVEVQDLILSLYSYLLSQATKENEIVIQTCLDQSDTLLSIQVIFNQLNGFDELFKLIHAERQKQGNAQSIQSVLSMNIEKDTTAVLPLVYNSLYFTHQIEKQDVFDISLHWLEEYEHLQLICYFNNKRLKHSKMTELMQGLIELIQMLTNQYVLSEKE